MKSSSEISKVSCIVPLFNHEQFIQSCLESILAQEGIGVLFNLEVLVTDDCSLDRSVDIVKDFFQKNQGTSICRLVTKNENRGLKDSIETGLVMSSGELVQILASDDKLLPDKIATQVDYLKRNRAVDITYSELTSFDDNSPEVTYLYDDFKICTHQTGPALLGIVATNAVDLPLLQSSLSRRDPFREAFVATRHLRSDDWALMIYFAKNGAIGFCSGTGFKYRRHNTNLSRNRHAALVNQLEVILSLVPENMRRRSLARVLQVHSLTYASYRDWKRFIVYALLSVTATGEIMFWLKFFVEQVAKKTLKSLRTMA